jgi:NAD(P)-dependent dehydrogenase (short-subunit alcohol dehydrogenase family)
VLDGKVVLITGAARGIGASMVRLLRQRGARLVLIDRDDVSLTDLVGGLRSGDIVRISCDVNDFEAMQDAAATAVARFGAIDVVVANAGIEHWAPVLAVDPEAFRRVIETNVIGVFNTVRVCLPSIIAQRGYVLVVASVSSYTAVPGMASYAASKAGVEHFANALRLELAHHGVDVGSAHMSLVDTPMLRDTQSASTEFKALLSALPAPMRRAVSAEQCADHLIRAIERRQRHVDVPRWVTGARWLKPLLSTAMVERPVRKMMGQIEAP